jgi:hypothetical protein
MVGLGAIHRVPGMSGLKIVPRELAVGMVKGFTPSGVGIKTRVEKLVSRPFRI